MKINWNIMSVVIPFFLFTFSISIAIAQSPVGNIVAAQLEHNYTYGTEGDIINNVPLILPHYWIMNLINRPDGGPAVVNPKIELETILKFIAFNPDNPDIFTPEPSLGLYTWDFSGLEVEEPAMLPLSAHEENSSLIMQPGFTASRSVEPKILSEDITLQDIVVEFRLEQALPEEINSLWISFGSPVLAYNYNPLVESSFISMVPVEGWTSGNNNAFWWIHPSNIEIGKTYTFQATLESFKSPELIGSPTYIPKVWVSYGQWLDQNPPVVTSNSVTISDPDGAISATFTVDDIVDWNLAFAKSLFHFTFSPVITQITPPPPPFHVLIPADVTIKPETLNLTSNGKFTAFVQLPEQYDIADIDISTVTCEGAWAIKGCIEKGFLVLKFNRQNLGEIEPGENVEFMVTGELEDGSIFEGTDSIRVK